MNPASSVVTTFPPITELLPHRGAMLLISEIINCNPDSLTASMCVPQHPTWEHEHFPGNPLLPGVLLIEAIAQAAGCHVVLNDSKVTYGVLRRVGETCFRNPIRPGECLIVQVALVNKRGPAIIYVGIVCKDNEEIIRTTITLAVS